MIAGSCASRRFAASTPRKFAVVPSSFIAFAAAATALPASARETSGLVVSALKSGDSESAAEIAARLDSTLSIVRASRASANQERPEERRGGKGWDRTCRYSWAPIHIKKK